MSRATPQDRMIRRNACNGLKPFTIVYHPYRYADGKPICQSTELQPSARGTHRLMAASEFEANAQFTLSVNRQVLATHEVTI